MAITLSKKTAPGKTVATVATELKDGKKTTAETHVQEEVKLGHASEGAKELQTKPWCVVGYELGYTKNLGNYQSAKVGIFLSVPCLHSEIDQVADLAENWVNNRMEKAQADLEGSGE